MKTNFKYEIHINGVKKKVVDSSSKASKLVYGRYKRFKQIEVYVFYSDPKSKRTQFLDHFIKLDNGFLKSITGYPLYI